MRLRLGLSKEERAEDERKVLMSEPLFFELMDALARERNQAYQLVWGPVREAKVQFYEPTVTLVRDDGKPRLRVMGDADDEG